MSRDRGRLDGKVTLITGSTRGIGRAMAVTFAAEGARVVVHGRRQEDAEALAATLPDALGLGADMADCDAVTALVAGTIEHFGTVDVLVNNAGISSRAAITRLTNDDWDVMLATNLSGPMYAIRAAVPAMKKQRRGAIVNVISGAATQGSVGFSAYAAAKGGLLGMTMTLARELAPFGIRVNAMSPAALTDMLRQLPPEALEPMIQAGLPTVESVADVALFLASDDSRYTTGQLIQVGGGIGGPPADDSGSAR